MRKIINLFMGRRKLLEESLSFSEVLGLLSGLEPLVELNLFYSSDYMEYWKGINSQKVIEQLKSGFKQTDKYPVDARHQVFRGKRKAKHYVDLRGCGVLRVKIQKKGADRG